MSSYSSILGSYGNTNLQYGYSYLNSGLSSSGIFSSDPTIANNSLSTLQSSLTYGQQYTGTSSADMENALAAVGMGMTSSGSVYVAGQNSGYGSSYGSSGYGSSYGSYSSPYSSILSGSLMPSYDTSSGLGSGYGSSYEPSSLSGYGSGYGLSYGTSSLSGLASGYSEPSSLSGYGSSSSSSDNSMLDALGLGQYSSEILTPGENLYTMGLEAGGSDSLAATLANQANEMGEESYSSPSYSTQAYGYGSSSPQEYGYSSPSYSTQAYGDGGSSPQEYGYSSPSYSTQAYGDGGSSPQEYGYSSPSYSTQAYGDGGSSPQEYSYNQQSSPYGYSGQSSNTSSPVQNIVGMIQQGQIPSLSQLSTINEGTTDPNAAANNVKQVVTALIECGGTAGLTRVTEFGLLNSLQQGNAELSQLPPNDPQAIAIQNMLQGNNEQFQIQMSQDPTQGNAFSLNNQNNPFGSGNYQ